LLAAHYAHYAEVEGLNPLWDLFKILPVNIVKQDFVESMDKEETQKVALALYWGFYFCFKHEQKHNSKGIKGVGALDDDGFEIIMEWNPEVVFDAAKELNLPHGHGNKCDELSSMSPAKPSNSKQAILALTNALKHHPGCVFSANHSIRVRVQAVKP